MSDEVGVPLPDPKIFIWILIIVAIPLLIELGLFVYSWYHADEVKCTWLWCEFTEKRSTSNITSYQECYENNVRINCTNMPEPDWDKIGGLYG